MPCSCHSNYLLTADGPNVCCASVFPVVVRILLRNNISAVTISLKKISSSCTGCGSIISLLSLRFHIALHLVASAVNGTVTYGF